MSVFVVSASVPKPELGDKIAELYPNRHYKHGACTWFVRDTGTTQALAEKIGISREGFTGVVVFPVPGAYWGVASAELWDWLRSAFEGDGDD